MAKVLKTIFLSLLFILGITFSMQNTGWVVLRYYFGLETPPLPLFLLVMFSIMVGVVLAGAGFLIDQWSLRRTLREKERQVAALENELRPYREQTTKVKAEG
ncbi:MAG: LapA family protein [Candidatus Binatia bacterium]